MLNLTHAIYHNNTIIIFVTGRQLCPQRAGPGALAAEDAQSHADEHRAAREQCDGWQQLVEC